MTQRYPNQNRSNRNFKASEAFDGTGIKRAGQFEARFPHTLSQITLKLVPFSSDPIHQLYHLSGRLECGQFFPIHHTSLSESDEPIHGLAPSNWGCQARCSAGSGDRSDTSDNKSGEIEVPKPAIVEAESRRYGNHCQISPELVPNLFLDRESSTRAGCGPRREGSEFLSI